MIKDFGSGVEDRLRMEHVTPELALIDPELAERARSLLPIRPDCLAPRPWPEPRVEVPPPVESRIPRRPSLLVAVSALCVAGLIGIPTLRHSASGDPAGSVRTTPTDVPRGTVLTGGAPLSPPAGPASGGACRAVTTGS
jgi:hypothetical protein